jgi:putative heme-binding domain-containing protein
VLQRTDPARWADRISTEKTDLIAWEAIIALCKIGKLPPEAGVFTRLNREPPTDPDALVGYLRTLELALFHSPMSAKETAEIAKRSLTLFPQQDWRVNRELAILLTHFGKEKILAEPPQPKLMAALKASADDRKQQIHYFYCMRLLRDGWTPDQKADMLAWFDATQSWTGGASFKGFLENILRDLSRAFTKEDVAALVARGEKYPRATAVVLKVAEEPVQPPGSVLVDLYARLAKEKPNAQFSDLRTTIIARLGKNATPPVQAALRGIADGDPAQSDAVVRALCACPSAENYSYLLHGLDSANKLVVLDCVEALKKTPTKPKPDDPAPYRAALLAARKLDEGNRWKAVQLLRHWSNNRQFGATDGAWKGELNNWGRWFAQSFPKEPPLPDVTGAAEAESKYKFDELLAYLEKEGKSGDAKKGRAVFEKAQCIKCHKYGTEGDAVGPDLSNVSKRFKRADVLESIIFPSKVISDQYRSTRITTKKGQDFLGLASAPQDGVITLLQQDGTKITLKESDIEQRFASLISVMPERLLDALDKKEIADLFAFLESEPGK